MTTLARSETPFVSTLAGHYYYDPEIYALEQERIFAQMWVCVGRAEAISGPGAYQVVTIIGEQLNESIIERFGDYAAFARYNVGNIKVGKTIVYNVQANWKLIIENFISRYFGNLRHCAPTFDGIPRLIESARREMFPFLPTQSNEALAQIEDERVFGWDPLPGIVSVWANREGRAVVWQRLEGRVTFTTEHFRPWLFATTLEDLTHLGASLLPSTAPGGDIAPVSYRELDGPEGTYRYLLSARDGRALERLLLSGATRRLGRQVNNLNDLPETYYRVGPVEQYLMLSGRVYFRGMVYDDLHRLQFDLETTALDPHRGRIFMVSLRDNRGLATTLEASTPGEEAELITRLCALIRERDPDVIENHNLFGFDLPFLEQRAEVLGIPLILGRVGGPTLLERREEILAVGPDARRRTRYSVAGREMIDTLDAVRRHDFVVRDMPSHRLKEVARYFGIALSDRVYLEGATIFETYRQNPELVRRYALDDVTEVDGLSRRLLGAPFALAGMAPRRYERLASAGPARAIASKLGGGKIRSKKESKETCNNSAHWTWQAILPN